MADFIRAVAVEPGKKPYVVCLEQPIDWEQILRWKAKRSPFGELVGIKGYVYGVAVTFVDVGPYAERPANVRYPHGSHPWINPNPNWKIRYPHGNHPRTNPDWEILYGPVIVTGSRPVQDGGTEAVSLSDDDLAWVLQTFSLVGPYRVKEVPD